MNIIFSYTYNFQKSNLKNAQYKKLFVCINIIQSVIYLYNIRVRIKQKLFSISGKKRVKIFLYLTSQFHSQIDKSKKINIITIIFLLRLLITEILIY